MRREADGRSGHPRAHLAGAADLGPGAPSDGPAPATRKIRARTGAPHARPRAKVFAGVVPVTYQIVRVFGLHRLVDDLRDDDFMQLRMDISKTRGLVALGEEVTRIAATG